MTASAAERLQQGLDHHRAGRLREADAQYRAVLKEEPRHPDALYLMGVLALQVGDAQAAVRLFTEATAVRPGDPEVRNMCGEAQRELGDPDAAIACYREALDIDPRHAGAWNNLGNACRDAGDIAGAVEAYERALAIDPDLPMAHNNLGVVLKSRGRIGEAIRHFEKALAVAPDYAEAGLNLGNALRLAGRREEAIRQLKQLIALHPGTALAHLSLGVVYDEIGRPGEAVTRYEKALALRPDYPEAYNNLGNALDQLGRHEEAAGHFRRAVELRPGYAEAWRNLSRIRPGDIDPSALQQLLARQDLDAGDAVHCHFALGAVYREAGDHDRAFEHYASGNRLKRAALNYDADRVDADIERLERVFDAGYFERVRGLGSDSRRPVFVLGMPRSGTTLVEQILASHPGVHGAGELDTLRQFEASIARSLGGSRPYPECLEEAGAGLIREYADRYLAVLERIDPRARRVTDKMPGNFLRIGLIRTLLPQARIIHVRRAPLDVCVSNYLHYFATGNEYAFDLAELGRYYLAYERLMAHWAAVLPDEAMLTVRYEELLADQEAVSRRMIDYLGLEWSDACLEFHRTERPVHTFSSLQVRRPIYASAVGRWRAYRQHLGPLIELLGEGEASA